MSKCIRDDIINGSSILHKFHGLGLDDVPIKSYSFYPKSRVNSLSFIVEEYEHEMNNIPTLIHDPEDLDQYKVEVVLVDFMYPMYLVLWSRMFQNNYANFITQ